jgi:hypothetical protein
MSLLLKVSLALFSVVNFLEADFLRLEKNQLLRTIRTSDISDMYDERYECQITFDERSTLINIHLNAR